MSHLPALVDAASSLALLALLAWSYGFVHRLVRQKTWANVILGSLFGGVALLQMFSPIEIAPGVIVDMRTVPVILAAAYLGPKGALPCLLIAIAARLHLGGIGMAPGVIGLIFAAGIGLSWRRWTARRSARGALHLLILGLAGLLRLVALLFLPAESAIYLFVSVIPYLVSLELIAIVVLGLLFERELRQLRAEDAMHAATGYHPNTGLLSPSGLEEAYLQMQLSVPDDQSIGVVLIKLRHEDWVARRFGLPVVNDIRCALRRRVDAEMDRNDLVGLTREREIAVFLVGRSARDLFELHKQLRRSLAAERISLMDGAEVRIAIEIAFSFGPVTRTISQLFLDARESDCGDMPIVSLPQTAPPQTVDALFAQVKRSL